LLTKPKVNVGQYLLITRAGDRHEYVRIVGVYDDRIYTTSGWWTLNTNPNNDYILEYFHCELVDIDEMQFNLLKL
jgi:hypothetical protein